MGEVRTALGRSQAMRLFCSVVAVVFVLAMVVTGTAQAGQPATGNG